MLGADRLGIPAVTKSLENRNRAEAHDQGRVFKLTVSADTFQNYYQELLSAK